MAQASVQQFLLDYTFKEEKPENQKLESNSRFMDLNQFFNKIFLCSTDKAGRGYLCVCVCVVFCGGRAPSTEKIYDYNNNLFY